MIGGAIAMDVEEGGSIRKNPRVQGAEEEHLSIITAGTVQQPCPPT